MEVTGGTGKPTDSFSIANLLSSTSSPRPNVYRHSFSVNDDPISHLRKLTTLPETMDPHPAMLMAGTSGGIHHHSYGHQASYFGAGAGGLGAHHPHHHHVSHQIPPGLGHVEQFKLEEVRQLGSQSSSGGQVNEVASVESADSGKIYCLKNCQLFT